MCKEAGGGVCPDDVIVEYKEGRGEGGVRRDDVMVDY